MRLTSDIYVSALLRRVSGSGGFGAVIRRGNREAGAIFLACRDRAGTIAIYGPAPQAVFIEGSPDERRFSLLRDSVGMEELDRWIEREVRFDSDIWVVEIEPGEAPLAELVSLADTSSSGA